MLRKKEKDILESFLSGNPGQAAAGAETAGEAETFGTLMRRMFRENKLSAVSLAVIALMILFTNPIGSHVIAKGAYKADQRGTKNLALNPDDYGRDFNE